MMRQLTPTPDQFQSLIEAMNQTAGKTERARNANQRT